MRAPLRVLRLSPGYSAIVICTVAFVVGLGTAVFSTVRAAVSPSSPFANPEQLYTVQAFGDGLKGDVRPYDRFEPLGRGVPAIEAFSIAEGTGVQAEVRGTTVQSSAYRVSGDFFDLLGVRPARGRFFSSAAGSLEVVVSDEFWRQHLDARPLDDGVFVTINGVAHNVVGVTPSATAEPFSQLFLRADSSTFARGGAYARLVGVVRIRAGQSQADLETSLRAVSRTLAAQFGAGRFAFRYSLSTLSPSSLPITELHIALAAATLAMLAIACANLANLALARAISGHTTHAVRRALGATRKRVVTDAIGEGLLLSALGSALGVAVFVASAEAIRRLIPARVPYIGVLRLQIDWSLFAVAVVLALVIAVAFTALPALFASSAPPGDALRERSATPLPKRRLYSAVVVVEVALALAMASSAVLMVRASRRVAGVDFGYDRRGLIETQLVVTGPDSSARASAERAFPGLADAARGLPGIRGATWYSSPASGGLSVHGISADGAPRIAFRPVLLSVDANYLKVLGVSVTAGRDFEPGDAGGAGSAVIDERAAAKLWPGESPVGKQLALASPGSAKVWVTVVGVARAVRASANSFDAFDTGSPTIYLSTPPAPGARHLVLRVNPGEEAVQMTAISAMARDLAPAGTRAWVHEVQREDKLLAQAHTFVTRLFALLAGCALFLAVGGLYAVLSHAGIVRQREFAIRLALGGTPEQVRQLITRDGAALALAGTALGGLLSLVVGRLIDPFLYDLYRVDAVSLVIAELVLLGFAFSVIALPARLAGRTSPSALLRGE